MLSTTGWQPPLVGADLTTTAHAPNGGLEQLQCTAAPPKVDSDAGGPHSPNQTAGGCSCAAVAGAPPNPCPAIARLSSLLLGGLLLLLLLVSEGHCRAPLMLLLGAGHGCGAGGVGGPQQAGSAQPDSGNSRYEATRGSNSTYAATRGGYKPSGVRTLCACCPVHACAGWLSVRKRDLLCQPLQPLQRLQPLQPLRPCNPCAPAAPVPLHSHARHSGPRVGWAPAQSQCPSSHSRQAPTSDTPAGRQADRQTNSVVGAFIGFLTGGGGGLGFWERGFLVPTV